MNNFEKKLEDASEEDLKSWINERQHSVVVFASDELTRRRLVDLQRKIEHLDKTTNKLNVIVIILTIVMIVLTSVLVWQGLK